MTIYLSALGWVPDAPAGNRLRWHYPVQEIGADGSYRGLPRSLIVERAPLDSRELRQFRQASSADYPANWWQLHGDIYFGPLLPASEHRLSGPVQAVSFTWRGTEARILFVNSQTGRTEAARTVANGDSVYAEGLGIDTIVAIGEGGTLEHLLTLDLFRDFGLDWERIAEIGVEASYDSDLSSVAERYGPPPTLGDREWEDIVRHAKAAQASAPADDRPGEPSSWDSFLTLLGLRWEYALLGGFAYYDGPRDRMSPLDKLLADPLKEPAETLVAYRVVDADTGEASNPAVVRPANSPPLGVPGIPQYLNPQVRLVEFGTGASEAAPAIAPIGTSLYPFRQLEFGTDRYQTRMTLSVDQSDPRALGVEVEEVVSKSSIAGSAERHAAYLLRTRRPEDPPLRLSAARSFEVAFPDVRLSARARAIDGWDRVSGYSAWSPETPLQLIHHPLPPAFASASFESGTTTLVRRAPAPGESDWEPDDVVRRSNGLLNVYRQTKSPRSASVTVSGAVPAGGGLYRTVVTGASALEDFIGGTLSAGGMTETIVAASGNEVLIRASDNAGSSANAFGPGSARLVQDMKHPALWTKITHFPAEGLPDRLAFDDPLPAPDGVAVHSYMARLSFFGGQIGPQGGIVRALHYPAALQTPPPFTVELLGIDFYHRTLLKVRFTSEVTAGKYTVWWADGAATAAELVLRGSTGLHPAQSVQNKRYLYDTLPLPIPQNVDRLITIGVQRVSGGAQSDFATIQVTLPALIA